MNKPCGAVNLVFLCLMGSVLGGLALPVAAAVMEIRAEFKPDPAKPHLNIFENKTPSTGYCSVNILACELAGMFSLAPSLVFTSSAAIAAFHPSPRQGAMLNVPAQWRDLTVVRSETGATETVRVRISGFGSTVRLPDDVVNLVGGGVSDFQAHDMLWTGSNWTTSAAPPCRLLSNGSRGNFSFTYFWLTPVEAVCARQARFNLASLSYERVSFAYELVTPNPLGMSTGEYTGSLTYTVGPGKDFDLGDVMLPNDNELTLNFTLDVQHLLKIELPPGGNKVELVPQGGWQAWLSQGRRPTRLFRDQTFNIWSSGRFKMELQCQFPMGNTCGLQAATGETVPLNIAVSLPFGIGDESGQAINRKPLLLDGSGTRVFGPTRYVERRPGALHFEIPASAMEPMFLPGAPDRYSGTATVIWDSEV
ncbi:hypothetical protein [Pseudomonas yamanorum]|nr:hypothetical protein [Pseudomonas yamanorum]